MQNKKAIFIFIFFLMIEFAYASQPLFINNIKSDEEAEKNTKNTIFTIDDYIGNWANFKHGCSFNKDLSFYCRGTSFDNCSILEKNNNSLFLQCLVSNTIVYANISLKYYVDIKNNDIANLNINIETHKNKRCFKESNNLSYKDCHSRQYDKYFSGEREFTKEELEVYKNKIK